MTCIIAAKTKNSVWIASDGRVSRDETTLTDSFTKWRSARNNIWWAAAGYIRIYTLAELNDEHLQAQPDCLSLCEELRKLVVADGWSTDSEEKGGPDVFHFSIIATNGDVLILYDGDGSYVRYNKPDDIVAIGSGKYPALGAAYAILDGGEPIEEALQVALAAAVRFDHDCGGSLFVGEIEP